MSSPSDSILCRTHKEIRSHFGELSGFFIALANILRPSVASSSTRESERARKTRQRPDQVSKQLLHECIGSSSPTQPSSQGSAYDPALKVNDDDLDEEGERKQAEVASSSLAAEFISLVIDVFLDQPVSSKKRLAFRESPTKFILTNQACTHVLDHTSQEWRSGINFCSVETKPSFTHSDEEGKGKSSPEIPQYACELIGAIMQRGFNQSLDMSVNQWQPLIVTHSCYMTILSATFTPMYLKYITGDGNEIDNNPPFLDIHCTKTHDLKTSVGRKKAAEDILLLCEKIRADGRDEDVESDGEGSEEGDI